MVFQRRSVLLAALVTATSMALAMFGNDSTRQQTVQAVPATLVIFVFGAQFHRIAFKRMRSLDATTDREKPE